MLQDETNRILNATRELAKIPDLMVKNDKAGLKVSIEQIDMIEDEVEGLRRKITREIADVGGLMVNRENMLNVAYAMDEIAGYISGIAFKLSNIKPTTLKTVNFGQDISVIIDLVVDEIYKINEIVRSLDVNTAMSIKLAQETQGIEREIDIKYRKITIKILTNITNTKELLLLKDATEGAEEMADKCQHVSDLLILLAI